MRTTSLKTKAIAAIAAGAMLAGFGATGAWADTVTRMDYTHSNAGQTDDVVTQTITTSIDYDNLTDDARGTLTVSSDQSLRSRSFKAWRILDYPSVTTTGTASKTGGVEEPGQVPRTVLLPPHP